MKNLIKRILAQIVYMLYRLEIRKCNIKVKSVDQMIEELANTTKSLVRFGDSDMTIVWDEVFFISRRARR